MKRLIACRYCSQCFARGCASRSTLTEKNIRLWILYALSKKSRRLL